MFDIHDDISRHHDDSMRLEQCKREGWKYQIVNFDGTKTTLYDPAIDPAREDAAADATNRLKRWSYLPEQLSGSFLVFDSLYEMPTGRIVFDPKCVFDTSQATFVASHVDDEPLAMVSNGSLFVGNPGHGMAPNFWVRTLRDTTSARQLIDDVSHGRIKSSSMRFALDDWRTEYKDGLETKVATAATISHICGASDPVCPFTSIYLHKT